MRALVLPEPAAFDREVETSLVLGRAAAQFVQEWPVDQLDMDAAACTGSTELAISISLRAASGSAKGG
jgi:hypothetical protein